MLDQVSIALYFVILAPVLECTVDEANCRVLICLVLYD